MSIVCGIKYFLKQYCSIRDVLRNVLGDNVVSTNNNNDKVSLTASW
jgi:hypothetical protein